MKKPVKGPKGLQGIRLGLLGLFALFYWGFHFLLGRSSLQLSQVVFDLAAGVFTGALTHVAIAKFFGPLLFGRAFCGWACWNAALFEALPFKERKKVHHERYLSYKYIFLVAALAVPVFIIAEGNTMQDPKGQLMWLLTENALIYTLGIVLAFWLGDKRAFCKYICPAGALMTLTAPKSVIKIQKNHLPCNKCHMCETVCPMNVPIVKYIQANQRVSHPECILCLECVTKCPKKCLVAGIGTKSDVTPEFGRSY